MKAVGYRRPGPIDREDALQGITREHRSSSCEGGANRCARPWVAYNVCMSDLAFEWDARKAASNLEKHGMTFEEARTVFLDERAIEFLDPDHSIDEDRFIMLGLSVRPQVLVVCHCLRESDAVIRLISARRATRNEERVYWRQGR